MSTLIKSSGNIQSSALQLPGSEVSFIGEFNQERTYAGIQVLTNTAKAHFWLGRIPGIGYDPADLSGGNDSIPYLPDHPTEWTTQETDHAETLLSTFGFELETDNSITSIGVAPYGPIYCYCDVTTDVHVVSA